MPDALPIVRTRAELRAALDRWRADGARIGFVPTMGALHEGHLSLVRQAGAAADEVVASVFVNPTQFAPGEDFDAYPRQEARDAELLAGAGCRLLFAPTRAHMYPDGHATGVTVAGPAGGLESAVRPHFFNGVATVVAKLLNLVRPDVAVFGEKDFQQLLVIRRLAADLELDVEILGGPTVRETDGLAMSSRNAYLTPEQRRAAAHLNAVLRRAAERLAAGASAAAEENDARGALLAAGFEAVDYVAVRDADDLSEFEDDRVTRPARVLAAARLGDVRLIDNIAV